MPGNILNELVETFCVTAFKPQIFTNFTDFKCHSGISRREISGIHSET